MPIRVSKESDMNQKQLHNVPEGYFENLQTRLSAIPQQHSAVTPWVRMRPYLAMAAAFAAMVVGGTALLRSTARPASVLSDEDLFSYAQLIPRTDPYMIYDESAQAEESYSEEDIINYLIETGVSLELLAYEADF